MACDGKCGCAECALSQKVAQALGHDVLCKDCMDVVGP